MILEKWRKADGTILATPVYYYGMTAQMKTFIDRNYFLYTHDIPLKSRCMGLIVVAGEEGIEITVRALRRCFGLAGGNTNENWLVCTGLASRVGDVKHNQPLLAQAHQLGKKMAEVVGRGIL
jgi:multimeric flavodoxin WrbA